jgi:hypothetical protein
LHESPPSRLYDSSKTKSLKFCSAGRKGLRREADCGPGAEAARRAWLRNLGGFRERRRLHLLKGVKARQVREIGRADTSKRRNEPIQVVGWSAGAEYSSFGSGRILRDG